MLAKLNTAALALAATFSLASAQTFRRLGTCPKLGCVLPPDQSEFLPGQLFDLRVEVHAPVNGSEAAHDGKPDQKFTVTIAKGENKPRDFAEAFKIDEPKLETWQFKWFEDLFAQDAGKPSVVNVAAKAYRKLALYEPGKYTVTLKYYDGEETTAEWTVRDLAAERKAKNVIFFIGDGMTTSMVCSLTCAPPLPEVRALTQVARSRLHASSVTKASTANTSPSSSLTSSLLSATR